MHITWLELNCSYSHAGIVPALLANAMPPESGVSWQVVRGITAQDSGELARAVVASRPNVVGATLYLFNRRAVLDTLARVRALAPGCRIAVGGPECLGDNRALLADGSIDVAIRGEGEEAFAAWVERLQTGGDWHGIAGLCWQDAGGVYQDQGQAPAWHGFATARFPAESPLLGENRPFIQYETARGCAGHCTFCTSGDSGGVRLKPLETIAGELAALRDRGIREFRLLDRTFNLPVSRCVALLRLFRETFPDLRFHLEIHPGLLTPEIREELLRARPGQLHVEAGVQSLSPEVLAAVGRPTDVERVLSGLRFLLSCSSFETHVDLLAGLPGQTYDQLMQDAARLVALGPAEIQLELLKLLPGTPLRREAPERGLVFSPAPPYEVLRTPGFPSDDLASCEKLSRLLDRFHNPPGLRHVFRALVSDAPSLRHLLFRADEADLLDAPASLRRRLSFLAREAEHNPLALEHAQLAWFQQGLSPDAAPWPSQSWPGAPPPDAVAREGAPPEDFSRVRVRHLPAGEREYWFVYDRSVTPHRPVCTYVR
jgi:hypothetical protein